MTGIWQDDRKEYDRTKDRQRTLGKYMIDGIPVGDGKIYNLVLQCGMSPDYTLPGRKYFCLWGVFPRSGPGDAKKSWNSRSTVFPGKEEFDQWHHWIHGWRQSSFINSGGPETLMGFSGLRPAKMRQHIIIFCSTRNQQDELKYKSNNTRINAAWNLKNSYF